MNSRVLKVAVCGAVTADAFAQTISDRALQLVSEMPDPPSIRVHRFAEPNATIAAAHHLVVSIGGVPSPWSDVMLTSTAEAGLLTEDRLVPWLTRWQQGRRAPRAQVAVLSNPNPAWAPYARRLIARLHTHINERQVLRIDHIGSTSVEGLAAKDLIDIQILVPSDDDAIPVADAATGAGFVHVVGERHGKDRNGALHPEQVCVDADPGRPVNVNVRSANRPVARDALLFRDWLRVNPTAQQRYLAMKSDLAGRQIDEYGDGKEPFISAALHEADAWATSTGWTL